MLAIFWKVKNIIYFWKLDYLQIYNSYELNSIRYHSSLHSVVFVMRNRDLMCDLQCWSYMYFPWLFGGLKKNTFQLLSNEYTEYKPYHASLFVQVYIWYPTSLEKCSDTFIQFYIFLTEAEILFNSIFGETVGNLEFHLSKNGQICYLLPSLLIENKSLLHFSLCLLKI